ncbi:MAG TPA: hypothetical protein PKH51_07180 [Candidatus Sumerlaeota bacterium]|nr:hypothetical protein [Candidatus Sumerlaeota bacterium]
MKRQFLPTFLLISVALLSGCNDQQVLYKTKSKETIPPVSDVTAAAVASAANPHASLSGIAGAASGPQHVDYGPLALKEPATGHAWAGLAMAVPNRYAEEQSAGAMRVAQFSVPAKSGDGKGELTVFHFGKNQGGSAADNVARWVHQFSVAEGKTTPVTRYEHGHVGDLEISRITVEGTYSPGAMVAGGAKPEPQENWALDAFIAEGGPEGNVYIRLTGPEQLVRDEKEAIDGMIASLSIAAAEPQGKEPAASAAEAPVPGSVPSKVPGVDFEVPADWEKVATTSSMRAAQYRIPGDAEFIVYYFGPSGGGGVSDNFSRWVAQVKQPDGSDSRGKMKTETKTIGSLTVNTLYVEGTYTPTAMGPSAPKPEAKSDQGFLGIVIEGGSQGTLYARITGPSATMRKLRTTMDDSVIPSMKKVP